MGIKESTDRELAMALMGASLELSACDSGDDFYPEEGEEFSTREELTEIIAMIEAELLRRIGKKAHEMRYKVMNVNEFTVIQYFKGGGHEKVREHVSGEEAVKAFYHYTNNVASKVGITERVVIVDYGDCINMEWQHGKGVTFPTSVDPIEDDIKKIIIEYHSKDEGE